LELGGNAARDNKKVRMTPRHIMLAIRNDEELHKLLKNVILPGDGVIPNIHAVLIHEKPGKSFGGGSFGGGKSFGGGAFGGGFSFGAQTF
jgi:histone H2A